jgi:carbon starvation protein CstA
MLHGFVYAKYLASLFGIDEKRVTPAFTRQDGVDFVPLPGWKVFLIQLLNIAGLGPIFGAVQGALFGPMAFVWIALGSVFAGAVHDYLSGMISLRRDGASLSEIQGAYLGKTIQGVMRVFTVVLLVLVGVVFVTGPAKLLASLTPEALNTTFWVAVVFAYYFLATILPIDTLIGRLYPLFGVALIFMAIGVGGGILVGSYTIPEISFTNPHPKGLPLFPMLFITIACGAISGFHATQSPMMARCLKNESQGRAIFYGSMISEGIIAMIWAAAGMAFYQGAPGLGSALAESGPGGVVNTITNTLLGPVGGILAMLGVIACPITSGDTAFRGARIMIADMFSVHQKPVFKRLALAVPLFVVGIALTFINFDIVWRYFAWANQTLAAVTLWAVARFLLQAKKNHWVATLPATLMTAVCGSYILQAKEGFVLSSTVSNTVGILLAAAVLATFLVTGPKAGAEEAQSAVDDATPG